MSTIQQGYLTPGQPAREVSWPATGNVSGVAYSHAGNAYSRKAKQYPLSALQELLAQQDWTSKYIGQGYQPKGILLTGPRTFSGGKRTRRRRSKSRKTRRRN